MQILIDTMQCPCRTLNDECGISLNECYEDDICSTCPLIRNGGVKLPYGHGRKFEEIVVEYPPAELCTYPEYKGKPYFSIKYEENGEHIVGFGTYNSEVLSRYLQEYFIVPTIIEADKESD